jgi:hypothetical protein
MRPAQSCWRALSRKDRANRVDTGIVGEGTALAFVAEDAEAVRRALVCN